MNIFLNDTSPNCTNIHTYIHTYIIHTYIHTYIHTHTHTHTHTRIATKVHSVSPSMSCWISSSTFAIVWFPDPSTHKIRACAYNACACVISACAYFVRRRVWEPDYVCHSYLFIVFAHFPSIPIFEPLPRGFVHETASARGRVGVVSTSLKKIVLRAPDSIFTHNPIPCSLVPSRPTHIRESTSGNY